MLIIGSEIINQDIDSDMSLKNCAGKLEDDVNDSASANQSTLNNLPADGAEWIDFFVREMMVATSVDDARVRAARMLEVLEKSISERAKAEATDSLQKVFNYLCYSHL